MTVELIKPTESGVPDKGGVDAGGGLIVRRYVGCRYTSGVDEPEGAPPFDVVIWAGYDDESQRYEIDRIEVQRADGEPALSSQSLRAVPVATLFRGLAERGVIGTVDTPTGPLARPFQMPNDELPAKLDGDAYRKIGRVHRVHEIIGNRATQELAEHFGVGRTKAYTWTKEITERGIMAPVVDDERVADLLGPGDTFTILKGDSMPPAELTAELQRRQKTGKYKGSQ